jgi:hypothetical protein
VVAPTGEAAAVAHLLDLPLASELADYPVLSTSTPADEALRGRLAAALRAVSDVALPTLRLHPGLQVRNADGRQVAVSWRVRHGVRPVIDLDAAAGSDVHARALAWAVGRWAERGRLEALLRNPSRADRLSLEADLDD